MLRLLKKYYSVVMMVVIVMTIIYFLGIAKRILSHIVKNRSWAQTQGHLNNVSDSKGKIG